jgi:glyoxylase-like metal-dependent hydrolase (beta-lactamase superfamily II)
MSGLRFDAVNAERPTTPTLPVADRWFSIAPADEGITLLTEPHIDPFWRSNIWHVRGRDRDVVVDTGNGIGDLRWAVQPLSGGRSVAAVVTHAHFDHMGSLHAFDERICHEDEAAELEHPFASPLLRRDFPPEIVEMIRWYGYQPPECVVDALPSAEFDVAGWRTTGTSPTRTVREGDTVDLGARSLEVLHIPGHTPGSLALWERATGALFVGDSVTGEEPVEVEDPEAYLESLARLREVPVATCYPGHGPTLHGARFVEALDRLSRETPTRT